MILCSPNIICIFLYFPHNPNSNHAIFYVFINVILVRNLSVCSQVVEMTKPCISELSHTMGLSQVLILWLVMYGRKTGIEIYISFDIQPVMTEACAIEVKNCCVLHYFTVIF